MDEVNDVRFLCNKLNSYWNLPGRTWQLSWSHVHSVYPEMRLAKYHGMHLRPSHQYHQLYLSVCQPISPELTEYLIVGTKQDQQNNNLLICVLWVSLLPFKHYQIILNTRMHSCRMHTACFSGHLGGEGGGVPRGCLPGDMYTHPPLHTHCMLGYTPL